MHLIGRDIEYNQPLHTRIEFGTFKTNTEYVFHQQTCDSLVIKSYVQTYAGCVSGNQVYVGKYDNSTGRLDSVPYSSRYQPEFLHIDASRGFFYATLHSQRTMEVSNYTIDGLALSFRTNVYHYGSFSDAAFHANHIYLISADSVTKMKTERSGSRVGLNVIGVVRTPGLVISASIQNNMGYFIVKQTSFEIVVLSLELMNIVQIVSLNATRQVNFYKSVLVNNHMYLSGVNEKNASKLLYVILT